MTGLNTQRKVVGREQDSGETERERQRERRSIEVKRVLASAINLTVGQIFTTPRERII
jgi:hypothetical protein